MVNKLAVCRLLVAIPVLSLTELSAFIFCRLNDILSHVASGLMVEGGGIITYRIHIGHSNQEELSSPAPFDCFPQMFLI